MSLAPERATSQTHTLGTARGRQGLPKKHSSHFLPERPEHPPQKRGEETVSWVKKALLRLCPKPLHLPVRYYAARFRGTLEFEATILSHLVDKGLRGIDIGAHHGLYTYALARWCRCVEAFEPDPFSAQTIQSWGSPKVTVHEIALSDFSGTAVLNVPVVGGRPERALAKLEDVHGQHESLTVSVRRLDDYEFRDVSFIKIDVEGHEQRVIRGASETLQRERPVILVEIEQRHLGSVPIETVFKQFEALGYIGSFLWDNEFLSLNEFSVERHQAPPAQESVQSSGRKPTGYVNNFIFRPFD